MLFGAPLGQRFQNVTLADVQVHEGNRQAVGLAKRIVEGEALSLLLYGKTARGKTMLLAAILNEVNAKWPMGRYGYWPLGELAMARRAAIAGDQPDPIERLLEATIVVIDDVGVEATTPYGMEALQTLVDRRWRDNLPLLLGSNLSPSGAEFEERYGPRILRRFVDRSAWLCEMGGESWATQLAPRSAAEVRGTQWTSRLEVTMAPAAILERIQREREAVERENPEEREAALNAVMRLKKEAR